MAEHDHDEIYGRARSERLVELLRSLAARIQELDRDGQLLSGVSDLLRLMGDARTELFHYEVRSTYDTPEVAEARRIVEDAKRGRSYDDDLEGDEPWRPTRAD
jgi:hypothetical protein